MYTIVNNKITLTRGDTMTFNIDLKVEQDGALVDYDLEEGDELIFKVKKNVNDKVTLIEKEGPTITIVSEDTEDLSFGDYVYDVKFTSADQTIVDHVVTVNKFVITEAL